jgi:hypothetical protein
MRTHNQLFATTLPDAGKDGDGFAYKTSTTPKNRSDTPQTCGALDFAQTHPRAQFKCRFYASMITLSARVSAACEKVS